jgi:sulfotransferase
MEKQIFFQSSLPRAGSTLLQNIMGQNPEFYVTPTSGTLELLYSAREQYSNSLEFKAQDPEVMKKAWLGFCKNALHGYYNAITDKPYVIDKSRGWGIHYDFLNTFIEQPKIICMVRDLRSVFSSMEKNFRKHPEASKGMVNWTTGVGTTIDKRVQIWANGLPVGIAITRLAEMINRGIADKIHFVRYEDLVISPEAEIAKIYAYLDLPFYDHNFMKVEQITKEDDSVYGPYGDHTIKKVIRFIEPDFNQILSPTISKGIKENYKWFYDYFKYD